MTEAIHGKHSKETLDALDAQAAEAALETLDVEPQGETASPRDALVADGTSEPVLWMSTSDDGWTPVPLKKRARPGRVVAAVLGTLVVLAGIAYAAGWWYFSNHYYPNTTLSGTDISNKTVEEVAQIADSIGDGYAVTVRGGDAAFTVSAADVDAGVDGRALAEKALSSGNPLAWPVEMQQSRDFSDLIVESFSAGGFEEELERQVEAYNETASDPKNAYIEYDSEKSLYSVHPEEPGTKLRVEPILAAAAEAVVSMQPEVSIPEDATFEPEITSTDERLVKAVDEANTYSRANIDLMLGDPGVLYTTLGSAQIAQWVSIGDDYQVSFNEGAVDDWVRELAHGIDTIGSERTYTRPDGATFTVSGGSYGWEIDNQALIDVLHDAIREGLEGAITVPTVSEGAVWNGFGAPDWGAFADVSIGEQHARFYSASGELLWESDVITGAPDGEHDTPFGIWRVLYTESPSVLRGEMLSSGVREYETQVQYWMQFTNSGCGFHDATWQWAFGGNSYSSGYGSHGCVNLPYGAAEELFGLIAAGNAVIVHE